MSRKNHRKGRPQARRSTIPVLFRPNPSVAPPVEKTIIPHGRCHLRHHKLRFYQHEVEKALRQAQALRKSRGQEAHMEKRAYHCPTAKGGCGDWHLTSRETWEDR